MNTPPTDRFVAASSLVPTCPDCGEVMQFSPSAPLIPLSSLGNLRYRCAACGERDAGPDAAVSRC